MQHLAVTRRALIQRTLAGSALLSLPWALSLAYEQAYLAFISECAESTTFASGISKVFDTEQESGLLSSASNLSVELGRAATSRILGLLDIESFAILESYVRSRGGSTMFIGRHGVDHVVEGKGSEQNLRDCLGMRSSDYSNGVFAELFEKSRMEGIGELIAKIAISTQTRRFSINNACTVRRGYDNSLISFVAQM